MKISQSLSSLFSEFFQKILDLENLSWYIKMTEKFDESEYDNQNRESN